MQRRSQSPSEGSQMIRRIVFSLFLLLIGIQLHANIINEYQTDIYYGNGIMTTKKEAQIALDETLKPAILHEIYNGDKAEMNRMHHFDVAYNFSMKDATLPNGEKVGLVGGVFDLLESYEQLKDTSVGWEMFDYLVKIINEAVFSNKP